MNGRSIYSEDPETTQWEMLMQYSYESNVKKELSKRKFSGPENLSETVAGAFSQAYEYFRASNASSLYTSPLLLYYGMANLLSGACQIMAGTFLDVNVHGMFLQPAGSQSLEHLADVTVCPIANGKGALSVFGQMLDPEWDFSRLGHWTLGELLGRMPDLYDEYCEFYGSTSPSLIPLERNTDGRVFIDRVKQESLDRYPQLAPFLVTVPHFSNAYLDPQDVTMVEHAIVLHQKPGGPDITLQGMSGSLFLCTGHGSAHVDHVPTQDILLYMTFFALGFLSRYRPDLWNPFVKTDSTGERHVFAKCVDVARRVFPNLVLNRLLGYSVDFSSRREEPNKIGS